MDDEYQIICPFCGVRGSRFLRNPFPQEPFYFCYCCAATAGLFPPGLKTWLTYLCAKFVWGPTGKLGVMGKGLKFLIQYLEINPDHDPFDYGYHRLILIWGWSPTRKPLGLAERDRRIKEAQDWSDELIRKIDQRMKKYHERREDSQDSN